MSIFGISWNDVKSTIRNTYEKSKELAIEATTYVVEGVKKLGQALEKAGERAEKKIRELGKTSPKIKIDNTLTSHYQGRESLNEGYKKQQIQQENEIIGKYQRKVKKEAVVRESEVKVVYMNIYEQYIDAFSEVFNEDIIEKISTFVDAKSSEFQHILRDEVNTRVSPSYYAWRQLMSTHPSKEELQCYCDKVYRDADNKLLGKLQSVIGETNAFISGCIVKYNNDRAIALKELKESLIKLTADEETQAKELRKIAEEMVVLQFIANETVTEEL